MRIVTKNYKNAETKIKCYNVKNRLVGNWKNETKTVLKK